MNTICLNMIVKNESHIIEKTLENLCQYIDFSYWVISDTGSTDNTVEIIENFFDQKKIPGEIVYDDWKNFAHNRNRALEPCTNKADYVFFFDADDSIHGNFMLPETLDKDAYYLQMKNEWSDTLYQRFLLVKNDGNFYWRGALHEFLEHRTPIVTDVIDGDYYVISGRLGSRNTNPQQKYLHDAHVLEQAIISNEDPDLMARYMFYLGNSYRDAENYEKAVEWYTLRIAMGGWIEEVTCAYENKGIALEALGRTEEALNTWLMGYDYNPKRAECLYNAVRLLRMDEKYRLAYQLGMIAKSIPFPKNDILFVKSSVYSYWIYYELSISAYYVKEFRFAYQCCETVLLKDPNNDVVVRTTINNLQFYKEEAIHFKENLPKVISIIEDYLERFPADQSKFSDTLMYLQQLL